MCGYLLWWRLGVVLEYVVVFRRVGCCFGGGDCVC